MMARSAGKAADLLKEEGQDTVFLKTKLVTADSYMSHALPQVMALLRTITAGDDAVLAMQPEGLVG